MTDGLREALLPCPFCGSEDIALDPGDTAVTLRPVVRWFAEHMERKLRAHDDRSGWLDCEPEWLLARLREETVELQAAMGDKSRVERIAEAADVANFAMIIADWEGPEFGPEHDAIPSCPQHLYSGVPATPASDHADGVADAGKNRDRDAGDSVTRAEVTERDIDRLATSRTGPVSPMVTRVEVERLVEEGVRRAVEIVGEVLYCFQVEQPGQEYRDPLLPRWMAHPYAPLAEALQEYLYLRAAATAGGKD